MGLRNFYLMEKVAIYLKNNNQKDLVDKMNFFLIESDKERLNKIVESKKKTKNYTIFNHFKLLDSFLNMSDRS